MNQKRELEAFVFDWSGVISDDRKPVYEANMAVVEEYGKKRVSFEEWLSITTMTPIELFGKFGIYEDDDQILWERYEHHLTLFSKEFPPQVYPDVHDVLQYLAERGKNLAVLSSHPVKNLIREAGEYGIRDFFPHFSGTCSDKVQGLIDICKGLQTPPQLTLYTGDTIYDIQAAIGAGVVPGGVCTGYHARERLQKEIPDKDFLFKNLSGLKTLV